MDQPNADLRRRNQPPGDRSAQNGNGPIFASSTATLNYGSANDYAMAVRTWLWAYQTWHMSQFLTPIYVQQFLHQQRQRLENGHVSTLAPITAANLVPNIPVPAESQRGNRYVVPAFGRRLLAEAIDFVFCFVLSLFVTYLLVEFEVIELSRYEKLLSDQADLKTLIDVTQDLFPIEIGKKILTSILEALFITYGFSNIPAGSTPGKFLLGLKVVKCASAQPVAQRDYRIIVQADQEGVSFPRALARSMIKNFALGFLFPLCITMYVFQFNRALYDIIAGTVVVEI